MGGSVPAVNASGRAVAITGAGRGIGRATAEAFARRGDRVAVIDIDGQAAEAVARSQPGARAYAADVSDAVGLESVIDEIERDFGAIDVLVNNAAVMLLCPLLALSPGAVRRVIEVDLLGPVHGMQLVSPRMVRRGAGHVFNGRAQHLPRAGPLCRPQRIRHRL